MAYTDYQHFLEVLDSKGELKRITEPVSPYLEITEIADRVMKAGGPALLFENVVGPPHRLGTPDPMSAVMGRESIHAPTLTLPQGIGGGDKRYDMPLVINAMGTRKRMSMALSCDDFEEHAERIAALLPPPIPKSPKEGLRIAVKAFKEVKHAIPKTVKSGICQEVVMQGDEIDLTKLPIQTCWPEDGGPASATSACTGCSCTTETLAACTGRCTRPARGTWRRRPKGSRTSK